MKLNRGKMAAVRYRHSITIRNLHSELFNHNASLFASYSYSRGVGVNCMLSTECQRNEAQQLTCGALLSMIFRRMQ